MKPLSTPRRLLQLDAWFATRRRREAPRLEPDLGDTRMPDDVELTGPAGFAGTQIGRLAAEVALEEGGRRFYAPREETQVLERRR